MTIRSDEPLSAGSDPDPESARRLADEAGAADAVGSPSASGSAGAAVSSGGALGGGAVGDPSDGGLGRGTASSPAGPDDGARADGASRGGRVADDPVGDAPADDGGGMSPVVREYTERLRREALARDAELRARGIDPYKGAGVDGEPRRRLGARPGGIGRSGGRVCGVLAGGAGLRDEPWLPGPVRRKPQAPQRPSAPARRPGRAPAVHRRRQRDRRDALLRGSGLRVEHRGHPVLESIQLTRLPVLPEYSGRN